jgi:hypothetical protein
MMNAGLVIVEENGKPHSGRGQQDEGEKRETEKEAPVVGVGFEQREDSQINGRLHG